MRCMHIDPWAKSNEFSSGFNCEKFPNAANKFHYNRFCSFGVLVPKEKDRQTNGHTDKQTDRLNHRRSFLESFIEIWLTFGVLAQRDRQTLWDRRRNRQTYRHLDGQLFWYFLDTKEMILLKFRWNRNGSFCVLTQTHRQTDRQARTQTDRQTDRQKDRRTKRTIHNGYFLDI